MKLDGLWIVPFSMAALACDSTTFVANSLDAAAVDASDAAPPPAPVTLTFELSSAAPGSTLRVRSEPAGVSCDGACATQTYQFPRGTVLDLKAIGTDDDYLFAGDCSGQVCKLVMDEPHSVKMRSSSFNYMFLTSATFTGNLGGHIGADEKCQTAASKAGLPGTYIAWLSTAASAARARLGSASGWIRPDGKPALRNRAAFEQRDFLYLPLLDELGQRSAQLNWTGMTETATLSKYNCLNYSNGTLNETGESGNPSIADRFWDSNSLTGCHIPQSLMCVGIGRKTEVQVAMPAAPVRRAFVSEATILPSRGVAAFDALCTSEASAAQLPNANKFRALITPSNLASAASRFTNPDTTGWTRIDGVALSATAGAFFDSMRNAALTVTAKGAYLGETVVLSGTGTAGTGAMRAVGGQNCVGWTSNDPNQRAMRGISTQSADGMFFTYGDPCDKNYYHLYCLED